MIFVLMCMICCAEVIDKLVAIFVEKYLYEAKNKT